MSLQLGVGVPGSKSPRGVLFAVIGQAGFPEEKKIFPDASVHL
jgi:hypothetical protein